MSPSRSSLSLRSSSSFTGRAGATGYQVKVAGWLKIIARYTFAALLGHVAASSRINYTPLFVVTNLKAITFDADFALLPQLHPAAHAGPRIYERAFI